VLRWSKRNARVFTQLKSVAIANFFTQPQMPQRCLWLLVAHRKQKRRRRIRPIRAAIYAQSINGCGSAERQGSLRKMCASRDCVTLRQLQLWYAALRCVMEWWKTAVIDLRSPSVHSCLGTWYHRCINIVINR